MSNLKPSMIGLDKGLNLQVAKIVAPPGSALDTLNYEQVDFQGQKRIDGYTRFDGSHLAALDEYRVITLDGNYEFALYDLIASDLGLFGVVAGVESSGENTVLYVAVTNENYVPVQQTQVYRIVNGVQEAEINFLTSVLGVDSGATPEEHYAKLIELNAAIRSNVEALPGPVAGLHWFRDRLHAVAAVVYISLAGISPTIYPGDTLEINGESAVVLDSAVMTGTRVVFLDSMNTTAWSAIGEEVSRDSVVVGTTIAEFEAPTLDEIASIFEARSEEQVLREDAPTGPYNFGWRFKHLGWKVFFDDGLSLYGSLPALNQNIEGVGTQGPTPTSDNNGAPAVLNQGVTITNMPGQVNGWKSTESNTTYSPTASDVEEIDDVAVYADAYISWDGSTGEVIGDTGSLTEYSPTNTIRISS